MAVVNKVMIVEGKTDKQRVQEVIDEPLHIICTHGTMSVDKVDQIIDNYEGQTIYVLADADDEGRKIRSWFKHYLSESHHIYIDRQYREVARCPKDYLARVLERHGFEVKDEDETIQEEIDQMFERVSLLT
ncbi:toprim domain-containing protein [Staphylococcus pettenkoferi]|uniref:toprim domain-containing protein n=1 Tax=Staphylococcus pettenkoferi TaxID=170573 RepID=UPI00066A1A03|nr:toprim domain-containing protein [Staphylococcus pettenkoferi]MDK7115588.1 toprim domain-containing protein [Staphylococcus pettenkoferi]MDK7284232.1 toprim domain-containing protein [Staphylococcus pettenkoferi]